MVAIIYLLGTFIADLLKSRRRLEVENLFLRHQLNIILRRPPQRLRLRGSDRALMVWMTRLWPSLLALARVVQPATILRWHRAGFRTYWRWKSQGRRGRPTIEHELRDLIRRMSKENPLWGAPRIHGELLKLGFEVAESTVSKYMIGRRGPPSQSWRTFLRNPCGRDCGDRSVRGSNPDLRAAVCLSCCRPWTAATAVVCGDPQSVGGMAGSTDGGGIPLEHGAHLFGARQ